MKSYKRIFGLIQMLSFIWFIDKILKILEYSEFLF
jgi:hypothetical protein